MFTGVYILFSSWLYHGVESKHVLTYAYYVTYVPWKIYEEHTFMNQAYQFISGGSKVPDNIY